MIKFCQNIRYYLLIFLFFCSHLSANWIDEQLKELSSDEKDSLRDFFAHAIKKDHLGHVLFFKNKPACLISGSTKDPLFIKGWMAWKAKAYLFPHTDFIFYDEEVNFGEKNYLHIYVINKKTLSDQEPVIKEHICSSFSKEAFLKDLETRKFKSLHENDQTLIGFLLGYGIESSHAYKERKKMRPIFCASDDKLKFNFRSKRVHCSINGKNNIFPVSFMGDPESAEVRSLQKIYSEELEKIETIYQEEDLLKFVLETLCGKSE